LAEPEVVVAVMYPAQWDPPADQLAAYLREVAAVSPRIRIVDERYADPGELRIQRGQNPDDDLRHLAPELTDRQRKALAEAEVVLTEDLPFDVVQLAPRLRWVQGVGAGVSQLISAGLPTSEVRLTTAAGVNALAISEFVLARILQIAKRFQEIDRLQVERVWLPKYGSQLAGRHLTVVGLGAIGRRVAGLGRAFGMTVTGVRRSAVVGESDPDVDQLLPPTELHTAVSAADYVVAAIPETAENRDIFDAKFFAAMPAGAVFVNVGRGSAVVEDDLVAALDNHLRAAALDVVRQEPLPADSPLWSVPNLFISPHSAAAPDQHWTNVFALFADNLRRYVDGEPLLNQSTANDMDANDMETTARVIAGD
jgi:phosphoglycerate dehydrogenase-like enzyme